MRHFYVKIFLSGIFLLSLGSYGYGQEVKRSKKELKQEKRQLKKARKLTRRFQKVRFFGVETGGIYSQVQDTRMQSSVFDGIGGKLNLTYISETPKGLHEVDLAGGQFAFLSPEHDESQIQNWRADINYHYLRDFRRLANDKILWRLGGAFTGLYNFRWNTRLSNSGITWDGLASLGVASHWSGKLKIPREGAWDYRITLPLATYVNRLPTYSLSSDGMDHSFAPIGTFTRILSEVGISQNIGRNSPNRVRLSYTWDFYSLNESEIHDVRVATHQVLFVFLVKL
ncbi:MAG: hypothetical protein AAF694_27105 [Bacteroidota bacterium]